MITWEKKDAPGCFREDVLIFRYSYLTIQGGGLVNFFNQYFKPEGHIYLYILRAARLAFSLSHDENCLRKILYDNPFEACFCHPAFNLPGTVTPPFFSPNKHVDRE